MEPKEAKDYSLTKAAYSLREAGDMVPVGRTKMLEDVNTGKLAAVKNGKRVMITAPAMVECLNAMPPRNSKPR